MAEPGLVSTEGMDFDEQGIEIPYAKCQLILGKDVSDKLHF